MAAALAAYPSDATTSSVVESPSGPLAFIAFDTGPPPGWGTVDVVAYADGRWHRLARLGGDLDPILSDPGLATVVAIHVTPSTAPDALVLLQGGSLSFFESGVVVSDVANKWHLVPFLHGDGNPGVSQEVGAPKVVGATIRQNLDGCDPNCASGRDFIFSYTYDPATGQFS
ncbi:MAG: hypothetical protein ACYDB7_02860 [Mycobacteriales bacterium]